MNNVYELKSVSIEVTNEIKVTKVLMKVLQQSMQILNVSNNIYIRVLPKKKYNL